MADWDGEGYEAISGLQRWLAGRCVDALDLRGDEQVLDAGCGDGFASRLLAARLLDGPMSGGGVLGIDASPRMIEVALARPVPAGAAIRFALVDILEFDQRDAFDLVVSFNALHWIVDQRGALRALATAVRPSGSVVVQVVCAGPRPSLEQVIVEVCRDPRWGPYFEDFPAPFVHVDPERYPELAASAGLTVDVMAVDDLTWDFGSRDAFVRWCTVGSADWIARLPAGDVDVWVADVVDRYEELVGRPGVFRFLQLHAEIRRG